MTEEKSAEEHGGACACGCDCECCKERQGRRHHSKVPANTDAISQVHVSDTVGASFLGILAILLLIFLVRANKRNRELLLEVIEQRRQA